MKLNSRLYPPRYSHFSFVWINKHVNWPSKRSVLIEPLPLSAHPDASYQSTRTPLPYAHFAPLALLSICHSHWPAASQPVACPFAVRAVLARLGSDRHECRHVSNHREHCQVTRHKRPAWCVGREHCTPNVAPFPQPVARAVIGATVCTRRQMSSCSGSFQIL